MALVKINRKNEKAIISLAEKLLSKGKIVAFPTDTVYGIAADPLNKNAVRKLYRIKGRTDKKPIALLVSSKNAVKRFASGIPAAAKKLMDKNWPGPLTVILRKRRSVPDFLTSGLSTIGIRMPDNRIALAMIKAFGGALAVTSANLSGKNASVSAGRIRGLKGIPLIIDGGRCRIGKPSSVIMINGKNIEVLRKGSGIKV